MLKKQLRQRLCIFCSLDDVSRKRKPAVTSTWQMLALSCGVLRAKMRAEKGLLTEEGSKGGSRIQLCFAGRFVLVLYC